VRDAGCSFMKEMIEMGSLGKTKRKRGKKKGTKPRGQPRGRKKKALLDSEVSSIFGRKGFK